uniref:Putative outcast ele5 orf2-h 1e-60-j 4 n=1 Tax=Amblyomma triste TaxID=251400 RepID=A0A023G723_AMBTT
MWIGSFRTCKLGFTRTEELETTLPTFAGSWKKQVEFQKPIYFSFSHYVKTFDCVDHSRLWQDLQKMGVTVHLICLLRNLYEGQEATVRTGHGLTYCFPLEKVLRQGCILSPCLFSLYAECIMRKAGLDESSAGVNIAGKRINNLRYADDTTLMAESEVELKKCLTRVQDESEKFGLKLNVKKTKIMASCPIKSCSIKGQGEAVTDFLFLASKITPEGDCSHEIRRRLLLGKTAMASLDRLVKSRDLR